MRLCFGFVLKTALITQGCFPYRWAVLTQSQGLFCCSSHPTSEWAGGAQEAGRGHSQDNWPKLTEGILYTIWCHVQHIKLGDEEGSKGLLEWWPLSSQVTVTCDVPGAGWTPACWCEVANEFLVLLCVHEWLLLYLLNCLYLNPLVFSLLPLQFSPPSHLREVSEQLHGAQLQAGVKPWYSLRRLL